MKRTVMHLSQPNRSSGLVLALGAVLASASVAMAQPAQLRVVQAAGTTFSVASVPYTVGEELTYRATFSGIRAGTARMRVDGIELVRGRPAYHVVFSVDGGVPLFRVHDLSLIHISEPTRLLS